MCWWARIVLLIGQKRRYETSQSLIMKPFCFWYNFWILNSSIAMDSVYWTHRHGLFGRGTLSGQSGSDAGDSVAYLSLPKTLNDIWTLTQAICTDRTHTQFIMAERAVWRRLEPLVLKQRVQQSGSKYLIKFQTLSANAGTDVALSLSLFCEWCVQF